MTDYKPLLDHEPSFIEPASRQEGLARLMAATLYRQNPGIPFFECGLVEQEIMHLEKWCRTSLRKLTHKEIVEAAKERRTRWKSRKADQPTI